LNLLGKVALLQQIQIVSELQALSQHCSRNSQLIKYFTRSYITLKKTLNTIRCIGRPHNHPLCFELTFIFKDLIHPKDFPKTSG
jgi:hypothetical protein